MNKEMLDIYSDYLIAQNQYATAVGLSDLLEGQISHDKITRFLNGEERGSKELWKYVKPKVRKIEEDKGGVLIIDDTIEEKMYTDENKIICWHYSHSKGRCIKGVNLLSCLARYGDIAFPIAYEAICKDVLFSDVATKKIRRQSSINKNQMFRSMIAQAISNQVKFEYVLADSWFGAKKNMEFIHYEIKKNLYLESKVID
jgi:SRSO17 transposase